MEIPVEGQTMSARDRILARVRRSTGGGNRMAGTVRLGRHPAHSAPVPGAVAASGGLAQLGTRLPDGAVHAAAGVDAFEE